MICANILKELVNTNTNIDIGSIAGRNSAVCNQAINNSLEKSWIFYSFIEEFE